MSLNMNTKKQKFFSTWWTVNNFYDVLKPFNFIAVLFGYCSLIGCSQSSHKPKSNKNCHKFIKYGVILLWLSFFAITFGFNIKESYFRIVSNNYIAYKGRRALFLVGIIFTLTGIIITHLVKKRTDTFLLRMVEFDQAIKRLDSPVDLIFESKALVFYILFKMCFSVTVITLALHNFNRCNGHIYCIYLHFPIYMINVSYMVFVNHFIVFGYALVRRYRILNKSFW